MLSAAVHNILVHSIIGGKVISNGSQLELLLKYYQQQLRTVADNFLNYQQ
jgi:hypothetical protein